MFEKSFGVNQVVEEDGVVDVVVEEDGDDDCLLLSWGWTITSSCSPNRTCFTTRDDDDDDDDAFMLTRLFLIGPLVAWEMGRLDAMVRII